MPGGHTGKQEEGDGSSAAGRMAAEDIGTPYVIKNGKKYFVIEKAPKTVYSCRCFFAKKLEWGQKEVARESFFWGWTVKTVFFYCEKRRKLLMKKGMGRQRLTGCA